MNREKSSSDDANHSKSQGVRRPGHGDEILNVRREVSKRRGKLGSAIHWVGRWLAHPMFFALLLVSHVVWVVLNSGLIPGIVPWDPYPFTFLATVASAEAPFISLLILMRQHQDARVAELREEIEVQVSLWMERELTTVVRMLDDIRDRLGVETQEEGKALRDMKSPLHPDELLDHIEQQLDETEGENEEGDNHDRAE